MDWLINVTITSSNRSNKIQFRFCVRGISVHNLSFSGKQLNILCIQNQINSDHIWFSNYEISVENIQFEKKNPRGLTLLTHNKNYNENLLITL